MRYICLYCGTRCTDEFDPQLAEYWNTLDAINCPDCGDAMDEYDEYQAPYYIGD